MFTQLRTIKVLVMLLILSSSTLLPAQDGKAEKRTVVEIRSELGIMRVALFNETPVHRDNFLKLVREGFYDSLLFHRVIPALMVQGGDPDSKLASDTQTLGQGGPGYTLPAEIVPGLYHTKGALAAVQQADEDGTEQVSSGSQFYLVIGKAFRSNELDMLAQRMARMGTPVEYPQEVRETYAHEGGAPHLDGAYTVFGQVVDGLEVLDLMALLPCDAYDRPVSDIRMWMRVVE